MRPAKVATMAFAVLAMSVTAWFSPTRAAVPDDYWCHMWFCIEMLGVCDEESVSMWCDQACPPWAFTVCDDEQPCDDDSWWVICERWT